MGMRRIILALCTCGGLLGSLACVAEEDNALNKAVDRYVPACSLHLLLPAEWTVKVDRSAGHCRITAEHPPDDSRCGTYDEGDAEGNGKKTYCDDEQRIVIDVQSGSIRNLTKLPGIGDASAIFETLSNPLWGDFVYKDGAWRIDSTFGNYRGAVAEGRGGTHVESLIDTRDIRSGSRRIVYAERPFRKYFQEGSYCCTDTDWEALADLAHSRFAWIEMQWPERENNVERFLRGLK